MARGFIWLELSMREGITAGEIEMDFKEGVFFKAV